LRADLHEHDTDEDDPSQHEELGEKRCCQAGDAQQRGNEEDQIGRPDYEPRHQAVLALLKMEVRPGALGVGAIGSSSSASSVSGTSCSLPPFIDSRAVLDFLDATVIPGATTFDVEKSQPSLDSIHDGFF